VETERNLAAIWLPTIQQNNFVDEYHSKQFFLEMNIDARGRPPACPSAKQIHDLFDFEEEIVCPVV
jgi:hypothetical protein